MKSRAIKNGELSSIRYHNIPSRSGDQCVGRQSALEELRRILDPTACRACKMFVLFGMGGVGKSRIALQYAMESRDKFEVILWITASNRAKITESFREAAKALGLALGSDDGVSVVSTMMTWLLGTSYHWLLVLDGVEDTNILASAWPICTNGSVLVTTRDSTEVQSLPHELLSMHRLEVLSLDDDSAVEALLSLLGHGAQIQPDHRSAKKLVQAVGGLPLAIEQMSKYIIQHALTLEGFLQVLKSQLSRHEDEPISLSATFGSALDGLSGYALTLQRLLVFFSPYTPFSPNHIYKSLLRRGAQRICRDELDFLQDPSCFSDAENTLLKSALIARSAMGEALYIHPLVQSAMMMRISKAESAKYFDLVTSLLSSSFLNTWNIVTNHQFATWMDCDQCIHHVGHLIRLLPEQPKDSIDINAFAELILRCTWNLYEREDYTAAITFLDAALGIIGSKSSLIYASALMLRGFIELDINKPRASFASFFQALNIRQRIMQPQDEFIASSLNALSLACTELNELSKAQEYGLRAIEIRLRNRSDRIGNSYSNMASTLLRMGKPDEAEAMLKQCPSIKSFSDQSFLDSKDPRFSGDVFLLSRIRQSQNRLDEALMLASAALDVRRKVLGRGLKTCASLYLVATLQHERGELAAAKESLLELVVMAKSNPKANGHRTQALFKLSEVCNDLDKHEDETREGVEGIASPNSLKYRAEAVKSLGKLISNGFILYDESEYDYNSLVPWMLW